MDLLEIEYPTLERVVSRAPIGAEMPVYPSLTSEIMRLRRDLDLFDKSGKLPLFMVNLTLSRSFFFAKFV
jgi:hypothetical protein